MRGDALRACACAGITALAIAVIGGTAAAAPGALTHQQTRLGDPGMVGARGVVVSPDGRNVYVAGASARAIAQYTRAADGTLAYLGCIKDVGAFATCGEQAQGLAAPQYVAISPDGRNVYAGSGGGDNAVVALTRDAGTGALSAAGCWSDTSVGSADCGPNTAPALQGAEGVTVSPDGKNVYAVAQGDSAISSFARDPGTGALTYTSCIADGAVGCATQTGGSFLFPREVTSAPDGLGVYAGAANSGVVGFLRNPADGTLSYAQTVPDLAPALIVGVAVSPDNGFVYAGSVNRSAVYGFSRNPATAALTAVGCFKDANASAAIDCPGTAGLAGTEGVVVAPDGASLYSASFYGWALASFDRSRTSGLLTPAGCFRDLPGMSVGCGAQIDGLGQSRAVTTSPDGRNVYATGQGDNAIVVFSRELPPADPPAATAGGGTPTSAPPTPVAPASAKPAAVTFASVTTLPSAKRCVSRRSFRIRLRQPKGTKLASATVKVNGKTATTRKGAKLTAPIDLRGLPKGKVTVAIAIKLADGRTVRGTRTYRTCAPKRRG